MKIRITKVSGEPISWREAFLRSSVDIGLNTIYILGMLLTLSQFPESAFGPLAQTEWKKHLAEFSPRWLRWLG